MAQNAHSKPSLFGPVLLLGAALLGFLLANSSFGRLYSEGLLTPLAFKFGEIKLLEKSFLLIVNDGLMALFFLFVGLELKREILVGELSQVKKALLPVFAAIGGMVAPALIYLSLNIGGPTEGWGIPMATDIAFAMGIITMLGNRVPASLKILLAAVAIVDDLGAIMVIALFYTASIDASALGYAGACLVVLMAMNFFGLKMLSLYLLVGIPLWYFTLKSGVHATIAGVLLACFIPLAAKGQSRAAVIDYIYQGKASPLDSPAVFLEKSLLPWVTYLIIPLFAFANAGVVLGEISLSSVSFGIIFGLALGKPLGVVLATYLGVRGGLIRLPQGVSWLQVTGLGLLAGVGFTMSLFISSLAFTDPVLGNESKFAILLGSLIAGSGGVFCFLYPKGVPEEGMARKE